MSAIINPFAMGAGASGPTTWIQTPIGGGILELLTFDGVRNLTNPAFGTGAGFDRPGRSTSVLEVTGDFVARISFISQSTPRCWAEMTINGVGGIGPHHSGAIQVNDPANTPQFFFLTGTPTPAHVTGDVYELVAIGDELKAYWNGMLAWTFPTSLSGLYPVPLVVTIQDGGEQADQIYWPTAPAGGFFWGATRRGTRYAGDANFLNGKAIKVLAGDSWTDALARSDASFVRADSKRVVWTLTPVTVQHKIVGVGPAGFFATTAPGYNMPYLFIDSDTPDISIIENVPTFTVIGTFSRATGDVMEIRVATDGTVTYWQNGSLLATSAVQIAAATPQYAYAAIYHSGGAVENVQIL